MSVAVALKGRIGALDLDVAFTVAQGQVAALIGPSGAGKTTVLRAIAGLERLVGGVSVAGEVWQNTQRFLPPHKRAVGYVFQDAALFSHLSVASNLRFGASRARGPALIDEAAVVELLSLSPLLGRSPARLSGGEGQRVALGRALLSQPRLLLLDEPVSSLDPDGRAEVLEALEAVHRALAIPVLYVSHDRAEVARLAGQVLSLDAGRIR